MYFPVQEGFTNACGRLRQDRLTFLNEEKRHLFLVAKHSEQILPHLRCVVSNLGNEH